ncbi:hypothetical protein OWS73_15630 [Burkholderia sp. 1B3(2022)]|uniref:hypothetical protein n=1 Tax=Burkholderia sp. 1B3(2022) TaxID=2997425 RepID=UPI002FC8E65D
MMPRLWCGRVVCRGRSMLSCLRIDRSEMALSVNSLLKKKRVMQTRHGRTALNVFSDSGENRHFWYEKTPPPEFVFLA